VSFGQTPAGNTFAQSYAEFEEQYAQPYLTWLKKVYRTSSKHDILAVANGLFLAKKSDSLASPLDPVLPCLSPSPPTPVSASPLFLPSPSPSPPTPVSASDLFSPRLLPSPPTPDPASDSFSPGLLPSPPTPDPESDLVFPHLLPSPPAPTSSVYTFDANSSATTFIFPDSQHSEAPSVPHDINSGPNEPIELAFQKYNSHAPSLRTPLSTEPLPDPTNFAIDPSLLSTSHGHQLTTQLTTSLTTTPSTDLSPSPDLALSPLPSTHFTIDPSLFPTSHGHQLMTQSTTSLTTTPSTDLAPSPPSTLPALATPSVVSSSPVPSTGMSSAQAGPSISSATSPAIQTHPAPQPKIRPAPQPKIRPVPQPKIRPAPQPTPGQGRGRGHRYGGKVAAGTKPDQVQLVPRGVRERVRAFESAQIPNSPSAASKATGNPAGMEGIGKRKRNPAKNPDGSDVQVNTSKRNRTS
jgi:hypothetical protein